MTNKALLLIALFLCVKSTLALAQEKIIYGKVLDKENKTSIAASVILYKTHSTKILSFTTTNAEGVFVFSNIPNDTVIIEVKSFGYQSLKDILFPPFSDSLKFELTKEPIVLSEVIIRQRQPIRKSNDTTTYNLVHFRDSTERNFEDILQKLPGFSVDKESGKISVNGQAIKTVLVDGEEISGQNYQIITKNLTADIIEKVQVINNFSNNPLLKNFNKSREIAINLSVNPQKRNTLFGDLEVGLGTNHNTDSHINLGLFANKLKTINFAGYNNVGRYAVGDGIPNAQQYLGSDLINVFKPYTRTINSIEANTLDGLSKAKLIKNSELSLSSLLSNKIGERIKVNGGILYYTDANNRSSFRSTEYFQNNQVINENSSIIRKPQVLNTHFLFDYTQTPSLYFQTAVFYHDAQTFSQNKTTSNINNFTENSNQSKKTLQLISELTKKINDNTAIHLKFNINRISSTEYINYDLSKTFLFRVNDSLGAKINQVFNQTQSFYNSKLSFFKNFRNSKVSTGIGFTKLLDRIDLNLTSEIISDNLKKHELDKSFSFTFLTYEREIIGVSLNLSTSYGYLSLPSISGFKFLPQLSLLKTFSNHNLFLMYQETFSTTDLYDTMYEKVMTSNRTFHLGTNGVPILSHFKNFSTSYRYDNFMKNVIFYSTFNYSHNPTAIIPKIQIENNYLISGLLSVGKPFSQAGFSQGYEYYTDKLKLYVKLKPKLFYSKGINVVNTDTIPYSMNMYTLDLSLRSSFEKINYHTGYSFAISRIRNHESTSNNIKKESFFADLQFKWGRVYSIYKNELILIKTKSGINNYISGEITLKYTPVKQRYSLELAVRNLYNQNAFINRDNTPYYLYYSHINIIPRYFMITGSLKI